MRKKIIFPVLTLILVAGLAMGSHLQANAMRFYGAHVFHCKKYVTMRKTPSASSKAIRKVKYGASLTWNYGVKKKNGFYNVSYGNKTGWIMAKYLNFDSEGCTWNAAKAYHCKSYISLRKAANSSSKRIAKIPKGQYVFINISRSNIDTDKYVFIDYRGKRGYVDSYYLKEVD